MSSITLIFKKHLDLISSITFRKSIYVVSHGLSAFHVQNVQTNWHPPTCFMTQTRGVSG